MRTAYSPSSGVLKSAFLNRVHNLNIWKNKSHIKRDGTLLVFYLNYPYCEWHRKEDQGRKRNISHVLNYVPDTLGIYIYHDFNSHSNPCQLLWFIFIGEKTVSEKPMVKWLVSGRELTPSLTSKPWFWTLYF